MTQRIFDRIRAIDTDTHITEPPDVWTARVSTQRWGDAVPHVKRVDGRDVWFIRDQTAGAPGFVTTLLVLMIVVVAASPLAAAPEGQMTWVVHISLAPAWFDRGEIVPTLPREVNPS